jgi:acyl-CoA thioester hydrolase
MTPARMTMRQRIFRDAALLFDATVTIVCIGPGGKPARLPAMLRALPQPGGG